jgi:hydroxymethylbilane synthase
MSLLTVGTRGSRLALAQSHWVARAVSAQHPETQLDIQVLKTTGDKMTTASLASLAADTKGLFVKEIEEALLEAKIDLAVHSLKDLPTELPAGLKVGVVPCREDPRDALVSNFPLSRISDLPPGAKIGTSSLRRMAQLGALREDLDIVPIRGNVDTRLGKLRAGQYDGIVLAVAGLNRLNLAGHISYVFETDELIPAIGQGCLALEVREDDTRVLQLISGLEDPSARRCSMAERSFLLSLGGGCQVPMGAYAEIQGGASSFRAFVAGHDGRGMLRYETRGSSKDLEELVRETVSYLLANGAKAMLSNQHHA